MDRMCQLVKAARGECSWAGICAPGNVNLIIDILVPKQSNTSVSTIFDTADLMAMCEAAGYEDNRVVLWGHSHDMMECFFSGTDIATAKKLEWDVQWSLVLNKKLANKYFAGKAIHKADYYLRLDLFYKGLNFTVGDKLEFTADVDDTAELAWAQITLEEQATFGSAPTKVYTQKNHGAPPATSSVARDALSRSSARSMGFDDDTMGYFGQHNLTKHHTSRHGGPKQRHLPADLAVLLSWAASARDTSAAAFRTTLPYMAHVLYYEGILKHGDLDGLAGAIKEAQIAPNDADEGHLLEVFCKQAKARGGVVSYGVREDGTFEIELASEYKRVQCTYDDATGWWMAGTSTHGRRVLHDPDRDLDVYSTSPGAFWKAKPIAAMWNKRVPEYMTEGCLSQTLYVRAGQAVISIWMGAGEDNEGLTQLSTDEYGLVAVVPDDTSAVGWLSSKAAKATEPPAEVAPPKELQGEVEEPTLTAAEIEAVAEKAAEEEKKAKKKKTKTKTKKAEEPKETTA